jgi:hypothetical protein
MSCEPRVVYSVRISASDESAAGFTTVREIAKHSDVKVITPARF